MVIIPNVESSIYQMLLSLLIHLLGVSVVCVELDASFINGGEFKNFIDALSTSTERFLEVWWVVLLTWHVITLQLVDFAFCIDTVSEDIIVGAFLGVVCHMEGFFVDLKKTGVAIWNTQSVLKSEGSLICIELIAAQVAIVMNDKVFILEEFTIVHVTSNVRISSVINKNVQLCKVFTKSAYIIRIFPISRSLTSHSYKIVSNTSNRT